MAKTTFIDGDPSLGILGTVVNAAWLNKVFNHRHDGADADGSVPTDYAADTGAANAYAITLSPAVAAYAAGLMVQFKAANDNTGASTLAVNGLAAKAIKLPKGTDPPAGAIVAGGIYELIYDGTNFQLVSSARPNLAGLLRSVQVFATPGSSVYTPTAGTVRVVVELVGAGGGGAGSAACGATGLSIGAGGSGGGYAKSSLVTGFSGVTVTVGAGGAGGTAGAVGSAGGSTSFGSLLSATGGGADSGGVITTTNGVPLACGGRDPGAGTGGNVANSPGATGSVGMANAAGNLVSGRGGNSVLGMGAEPRSTDENNGRTATGAGGGGSGGCTRNNGSAKTGGDGAPGLVIVYEYI